MKTPRNTVFSKTPDLCHSSYRRRALTSSIAALLTGLSVAAGGPHATAATWWLGENGSSWTGNNWASDSSGTLTISIPTAADDVTFSATGAANQGATTLDQNFTIHSLTISDLTPVVINSGTGGPNTLTISGNAGTGITANTGTSLTVNTNVALGGASDTITTNGTATVNLTGTLSGSNGLIKNGTGTLALGGSNTYTGTTTVNAGALQLSGATPTLNGGVNLAGSSAKLVLPSSVPGGLTGQYYDSMPMSNNGAGGDASFDSLSALQTHLSTLTPTVTANSGLVGANFDFGNNGQNFPAPYNTINFDSASNLEVEWTGEFFAQTTGTYTFGTSSDDGSMIFIDGNPVVNNNLFQGFGGPVTSTVTLTAGLHNIVIGYYQGGGGDGLQAFYEAPGGSSLTLLPNSLLYAGNPAVSIGALTGVAGSQVVLNGAFLTVNEDVDTTFAGAIVDGSISGGSLTKAGVGTLTLTGANTYTGATTISAGTLQLGDGVTAGASLASSSITTNSGATFALNLLNGETFATDIANNGHVVANGASVANNYTISGVISGAGDFTKNGANTVTLTGDSTYTGVTTINAGTLQLGNGGTSGSIVSDVVNNGTLAFNRSDDVSFAGNISGAGGVTKSGAGMLTFNGATTYTGITTVNAGTLQLSGTTPGLAGAVNLTSSTAQLVVRSITPGGLVGQYYNFAPQSNNGTGGDSAFDSLSALQTHLSALPIAVTANSSLVGANFDFGTNGQNFPAPYTGPNAANNLEVEWSGQFLAQSAGTYTFGTSSDDGSVVFIDGNLVVDNNLFQGIGGPVTGTVTLTAGIHDIVIGYYQGGGGYGLQAFYEAPGGSSLSLLPNSLLSTAGPANVSIGSLTGVAGSQVILNGAALTINQDFDTTFAGAIVDGSLPGGSLIKAGAATLTLSGANTYTGTTTINSGALRVNGSLASSAVAVNSGGTLSGNGSIAGAVTLNSGGFIAPGAPTGTLTAASLLWNGGGQLNMQIGANSSLLAVTGALTKGTAGSFGVEVEAGVGLNQNHYTLVTFGSQTGFLQGDFSLISAIPGLQGHLTLLGNELDLDISSISVSSSIIQNSFPIGTPSIADFFVNGPVTTGGPGENNQIRTLTFALGGSLLIHNTLYVTQGPIILPSGSTITLDGSLSASELQMLFGSLLNGNGNILGNLVNGGLVSPGHSPGQIHVSGNYTQSQSGTLQIQIAGRDLKQHDLLSVGGTATLGGALQILPLDGFRLKRNKPITFLTAGEGVIGRFSLVENGFTSDTILEPTVVYHSNSVDFEAVQGSFAALADLTPNQKSVAQALDSLPTKDRRTNSLLDYLDYRKLNELPRDFDKIAPEELTSVFTIGVSLANVQSQNIQRRNDDIRSGAGGFNAAGLALNSDGPSYSGSFFNQGVAGPNGNDDGKEMKETKTVTPEEARWGAFLSGTGEWVNVGNTDNARGYNLESGGFTLGLDYKVTPNLAIGIAGGYTGTTADLADGGRVYANGGKIGLYATFFDYKQEKAAPTMSKDNKEALTPTYAVAQGLYADVAVFGGYNSYDTHRSALQGEARGDTDGGELNVLFGTGYDFKKGNLTFGPTASFNYTYLGTNAFTEHGSLAPLDIHGGKGESLRTALGFKASYDWRVGGIVIKPELRASWQHEYGDSAYALDSSFANGASDAFRVNGPQLGRDSALLGAGFAIQLSDRCSTYFYYDGELGRKNYQSTSVTGGLRLAF